MGSGNLCGPKNNNFHGTTMQEEERFPLPAGVRPKHGSYHFVKNHKWQKLCRISEGRIALYMRLMDVGVIASDTVWFAILSYIRHGMADLAEETKISYRGYAMNMLHHFAHYRISEVEPTHGKQYLVWCKANNRATVGNRERSFMSSVWEYAMGEGWATYNPWRGFRRNKERPGRKYVEHATLSAEIDRAPPELVALYSVAYLLGIRQTDLRLAKETQIDGNILRVIESKTKKENEHPITPTVALFLRKAIEHREAVAARYEAAAVKLEADSQFRRAEKRRAKAAAVRATPYIFVSSRGLPWSKWGLQSALRRFKPAFQFRQLRPKAQTDRPDANILGHVGQMREVYTRKRKLAAVK